RAERADCHQIARRQEPARDVVRALSGRGRGDLVEEVPVAANRERRAEYLSHARRRCTRGARREPLTTREVARGRRRLREDPRPQGGESLTVRRPSPCNWNWA